MPTVYPFKQLARICCKVRHIQNYLMSAYYKPSPVLRVWGHRAADFGKREGFKLPVLEHFG